MDRVSVEVWPHVVVNGEEIDCHFDQDRNVLIVKSGLDPEAYVRIGVTAARAKMIPIVSLSGEHPSLS